MGKLDSKPFRIAIVAKLSRGRVVRTWRYVLPALRTVITPGARCATFTLRVAALSRWRYTLARRWVAFRLTWWERLGWKVDAEISRVEKAA